VVGWRGHLGHALLRPAGREPDSHARGSTARGDRRRMAGRELVPAVQPLQAASAALPSRGEDPAQLIALGVEEPGRASTESISWWQAERPRSTGRPGQHTMSVSSISKSRNLVIQSTIGVTKAAVLSPRSSARGGGDHCSTPSQARAPLATAGGDNKSAKPTSVTTRPPRW
jgi:hypothetical protein